MRTALVLLFIALASFGKAVPGKAEPFDDQFQADEPSDAGDFIVEVRAKFFGIPKHYCYGALIDRVFVLVPARCVEKQPWFGFLEIVVGSQVFGIKYITLHERFKEYNHDIAVVRLDSPANPSETGVNVVFLPYFDLQVSDTATFLKKNSTAKFTAIKVTVKPLSECAKLGGSTETSELCVGGDQLSALKGEEGSPLVVFNRLPGKILVGLLSYAEESPAPAIYTNVCSHSFWIMEQFIRVPAKQVA